MRPLILHPTDISQWHALVHEAQTTTRLVLNENTESYLVFLLMRFSHGPKLVESVIALDFLNAMHQKHRQMDLLRDVGDKSLLFCGLFPGIAERRHLNLSYFAELGQAAYLTIGESQTPQTANLYYQLSMQFVSLQHILNAMRSDVLPEDSMEGIMLFSKTDTPLQ